jgi:nitrous oxidase accessory protein
LRKIAALLLVLLNLTALCVVVVQPIKAGSKTIVVPDDYGTIQYAVDNASSGDTVLVRNGTYKECISISKSLSLIGENKEKTKILGDWKLGGTVVLVNHDNVTVKGFTIQSIANNTHGNSIRGIHLLHVRQCIVSECKFSGVGLGIWLYGSSDNTIENNYIEGQPPTPPTAGTLHFGFDGIIIADSSYNNILRNTITGTYFSGIVLSNSVGNNLTGNHVKSDYVGVGVSFSNNNTIASNKISGNRYGIAQDSSSHNTIASNIIRDSATGIQINSSSCFNLVENNTITDSRYCGVEIHYNANHNKILGNNITDNKHGLELKLSSNNTLRYNNVTGNNGAGIILVESSNNLIYQNNFVNNSFHVSNDGSINTWDTNNKGNYWDNYTGTDSDSNGLGESPYLIDETNKDNYPLIEVTTILEFQQEDNLNHATPTASPSAIPTTEPSPTLLVAITSVTVAVGLGLIFYFTKIKTKQVKNATKGS